MEQVKLAASYYGDEYKVFVGEKNGDTCTAVVQYADAVICVAQGRTQADANYRAEMIVSALYNNFGDRMETVFRPI